VAWQDRPPGAASGGGPNRPAPAAPPASIRDQALAFIRQYGPAAALAVPAVILGYKTGGKQLVELAHKFLNPKAMQRLHAAPEAYMFSQSPDLLEGPAVHSLLGGSNWIGSAYRDAAKQMGRAQPPLGSRLMNLPPDFFKQYPGKELSTLTHELEHMLGGERMMRWGERHGGLNTMVTAATPTGSIGTNQLDLFGSPTAWRAVQRALQPSGPAADYNRSYYLMRSTEGPQLAYGELLTNILGQLRHPKVQPWALGKDPWSKSVLERATRSATQYPGRVDVLRHVIEHGRLPDKYVQDALDTVTRQLAPYRAKIQHSVLQQKSAGTAPTTDELLDDYAALLRMPPPSPR
jgi:hypothetical protein